MAAQLKWPAQSNRMSESARLAPADSEVLVSLTILSDLHVFKVVMLERLDLQDIRPS
jgi:hypothetical protein